MPIGSTRTSEGDVYAAQEESQVRAAETRLLYENAPTGTVVTVVIALLLAYAEWNVVSRIVVVTWLAFMLLLSVGRFVLVHWFRRASPRDADMPPWNTAFVAGTAVAAIGWGAAATVMYPAAQSESEILVVFAIGGVMLGGASLLAARPEAFITFLAPVGILTAARLANEGDERHLIMGFLAVVYTGATLLTTWRFHLAIRSSLKLRVANHDLIESLERAKNDAEALNRDLELRVRDRTAELTEADQRKNEFLATLAHELRNPLAPIRFALETLKLEAAGAAGVRARGVIDRQVTQLVRLVDDLLDVSRITANKIQLRRESLDLASLMTTATESTSALAAAAGQTLDVRVPPAPLYVSGDAARLVQVFANVLNNAVKFTPRGGDIRFSAEQQSDQAIVRITDTGLGITSDVLPRVFDMFQQAEGVLDRSTGGLGIGLTLARRLVEMHQGRITIASAGTGKGTEVEIRLPLTSVPPASVVATPQMPVAPGTDLRVLIVEDNRDAAEMLEFAVSSLGYVTQVAHDGGNAVSVARSFGPDVVFLDIGLPVMNGYEVARALRGSTECRDAYIAAVTGWGQDEDRRKARDAGCDSHFTKPLSPTTVEELLVTISSRLHEGRPANGTPRTRRSDSIAPADSRQ